MLKGLCIMLLSSFIDKKNNASRFVSFQLPFLRKLTAKKPFRSTVVVLYNGGMAANVISMSPVYSHVLFSAKYL